MNILNAGYSAELTLAANDVVTINPGASVVVEAVSGLGLSAGVIGTYADARTLGPYPAGVVKLTAVMGDCSYGVSTGASAVTSTVNPLTGGISLLVGTDVVVDGTIYTWATRPAAAGNTGKTIRISDVGNTAAGSHWISDGSYWRPVGGRVTLAQKAGGPFNPVSQNTGGTTYIMTQPVQPVIPADMLIPGESQIEYEVWVRRVGANGTATLKLTLGINNAPTTDMTVGNYTLAATDAADINPCPLITSVLATKCSSTSWLARHGSTMAATGVDSGASQINTAAAMYGNIYVTSANALDTFRLVAYRFTVIQ